MKDSIILDKTYRFGLEIIRLHFLLNQKKMFVISKQLLRCGTSIGANVEESQGAISKKDFIHKLTIAYKEARESQYWLRLISDSMLIDGEAIHDLHNSIKEIQLILASIIKSSKENLPKN